MNKIKYVEIVYPSSKPFLARIKPHIHNKEEIWVEGHGDLQRLIEQHQCKITYLLPLTIDMLDALYTVVEVAAYNHQGYSRIFVESKIDEAIAMVREVTAQEMKNE